MIPVSTELVHVPDSEMLQVASKTAKLRCRCNSLIFNLAGSVTKWSGPGACLLSKAQQLAALLMEMLQVLRFR